jgi:choline dehydrogenase-like flavoprotein
VIRLSPNLVAEEFQSRGLPHKLRAIAIDAISEQMPDPDSRINITLSQRTDRLGLSMAKVDWCINDHERRTIIRIAHITWKGFSRAGLPTPVLEPWVAENRPEDSVMIVMAHTIGTTRMLTDPKLGVVDDNCQVHGVRNMRGRLSFQRAAMRIRP